MTNGNKAEGSSKRQLFYKSTMKEIPNIHYPVFVQKLELDLHIRSQSLEFQFLLVKHLFRLTLLYQVDLGFWGRVVKLQITPVCIKFGPENKRGNCKLKVDSFCITIAFQKTRSRVPSNLDPCIFLSVLKGGYFQSGKYHPEFFEIRCRSLRTFEYAIIVSGYNRRDSVAKW